VATYDQGMTTAPLTTLPTRAISPRATLLIPALLAWYIVWGSTYLAIHVALESFPPFFQMGTRFLVAGAVLMTWVIVGGRQLPTVTQWRNAFVVGGLMLGVGMGLLAKASAQIGSGLIASFIAVVPMMVCGWALLAGRRPGRMELTGMVLGLVGVFLLMRAASFSAAPAGVACMFGATLSWSLGSVLSTTRLPLAAGPCGFASEMLCGGAVLMTVSLALGEQPVWPPGASATAAWLYLVVFGSLTAFSAYMYLLAHASAALATSYAFVNPLIALFLGVVFANEAVSNAEWLSCAVILAGVLFIALADKKY
jgi:drug/metabolite transporter (DMT)-like permease